MKIWHNEDYLANNPAMNRTPTKDKRKGGTLRNYVIRSHPFFPDGPVIAMGTISNDSIWGNDSLATSLVVCEDLDKKTLETLNTVYRTDL